MEERQGERERRARREQRAEEGAVVNTDTGPRVYPGRRPAARYIVCVCHVSFSLLFAAVGDYILRILQYFGVQYCL